MNGTRLGGLGLLAGFGYQLCGRGLAARLVAAPYASPAVLVA
jgi:hypothetical protein